MIESKDVIKLIGLRPSQGTMILKLIESKYDVLPEGGYPKYLILSKFQTGVNPAGSDQPGYGPDSLWNANYEVIKSYSKDGAHQKRVKAIEMICMSPLPDVDKVKYQKWLIEQHIPLVMRFPGVITASCNYAARPLANYPQYIDMYTFEDVASAEAFDTCDAIKDSRSNTMENWGRRPHTVMWRVRYQVIPD